MPYYRTIPPARRRMLARRRRLEVTERLNAPAAVQYEDDGYYPPGEDCDCADCMRTYHPDEYIENEDDY